MLLNTYTRNEMDDMREDLLHRIALVDSTGQALILDSVEQRVDAIEAALPQKATTSSVSVLNGNLTSLSGSVTVLQNAVTDRALKTDVATTNATVAAVSNNLTTLTTRVGTVESQMSTLATTASLTTTNTNVANLTTRVSATESTIAGHTSNIGSLQSSVYSLNNSMSNKASYTDVAYVDAKVNTLDARTTNIAYKDDVTAVQNYALSHEPRITSLESIATTVRSGFRSTATDFTVYYAVQGLVPYVTQVNIDYHWSQVVDTVTVQGRVVIPGVFETVANSNGVISFRLPVAISGTFPAAVNYVSSGQTNTNANGTVSRAFPRLLGHAWMDGKINQAYVDTLEVSGASNTNNVASITLQNNATYSNVTILFHLMYRLPSISYAGTVTNQVASNPTLM